MVKLRTPQDKVTTMVTWNVEVRTQAQFRIISRELKVRYRPSLTNSGTTALGPKLTLHF